MDITVPRRTRRDSCSRTFVDISETWFYPTLRSAGLKRPWRSVSFFQRLRHRSIDIKSSPPFNKRRFESFTLSLREDACSRICANPLARSKVCLWRWVLLLISLWKAVQFLAMPSGFEKESFLEGVCFVFSMFFVFWCVICKYFYSLRSYFCSVNTGSLFKRILHVSHEISTSVFLCVTNMFIDSSSNPICGVNEGIVEYGFSHRQSCTLHIFPAK